MAEGRPPKYRSELDEQAEKLALLGATDVEMADFFGVHVDTIYTWAKTHPTFSEARARGKLAADANVAQSVYRRANGYSHDAVKIFMPQGAYAPVYAPYTEHYPPDTQAATWWLKNRRPREWKDKQEIEHSGDIGLAEKLEAARARLAAKE